jgi:hypothetical protein
MDIENLIKDTFTAHEHVAPDGDEVLAAARRRIDRGRTVVGRPFAVAAGVVALTLVAVTVIALNRSGSPDSAPVAAPSGTAEQVVDDLAMPFALDWLPPGEVDYQWRRISVWSTVEQPDVPVYGGEYGLTVTADGQILQINVQEHRKTPVDIRAIQSGPGRPVTIGGRQGVESSRPDGPGGYELYVAGPDGGSMYVHVSVVYGSSTVPPQQLIDTGRRIAENIRFPGTATVTPAFGLRDDLPDGLRICAFGVEKAIGPIGPQPSTSYSLGTCTTIIPSIHVSNTAADKATGTPGRPVQGRETRHVSEEGGGQRLWVLDAVDGAAVTLMGDVPVAELYEIADRLVLPEAGS